MSQAGPSNQGADPVPVSQTAEPSVDKGKRKRGDTPPLVPTAWVMDIIREATTKEVHDDLKAQFMSPEPDMKAATAFFDKVNEKIEETNKRRGVDPKQGTIASDTYERLFGTFLESIGKSRTLEEANDVFDAIHKEFDEFNKEHHLPAEWNIARSMVETLFRSGIKEEPGNGDDQDSLFNGSVPGMPDYMAPEPPRLVPEPPRFVQSRSGQEPVSGGADASNATGLDELEAETREHMRSLSDGKVLFWWKKGTGSQTFVQYGTESHPIYRIRAGSYEFYDPKAVPQILSAQQSDANLRPERATQAILPRGRAKLIIEDDDGNLKETWKFTRADVAGIIGIGWKVDDDDEESVEPLDLIWPEPYACYPQTRSLVKWKDGMITLEDRAFLRRITHGSNLQGDRVIYQKALKSEVLYRQEQGLPYEHLMDKLAASKARTPVATQEDDDEPEVITVASQTPTPATPRPQRGQSRASEVRFALPRSTPSRAVTPSQSVPPAESPQNEELMYLRERVAQLEAMAKQPGPRYNLRRSATPAWGNYNRFQSEVSDYTPEPPRPRRGRGRRGGRQPAMMWDNWSGQWAPAY